MIAQLVYDSLLETSPSGGRTPKNLSRHVLYRMGDYFVDLLLEFQNDVRIAMTGQVMDKKNRKVALSQMPVELMRGSECVCRTETNEHGEFQMEFDAAGQVRLECRRGEDMIEVPFSRTVESDPAQTGPGD